MVKRVWGVVLVLAWLSCGGPVSEEQETGMPQEASVGQSAAPLAGEPLRTTGEPPQDEALPQDPIPWFIRELQLQQAQLTAAPRR